MTVSEFPTPPTDLEDQRRLNRLQSQTISGLMSGRSNNVLDVTLIASSTSTTVTDARIGVNTVALCIPTTASAAAIAAPYRDFTAPVNGSMSLIHPSSAAVDLDFKVILVG